MNCNESKFQLEIVIVELSDSLGRKYINSCIHAGNHVIGDIWQVALGEAFESSVCDAIENLEKNIEIDFPEGTPVEIIFDCLYYAQVGMLWYAKSLVDILDDAAWNAAWNENAKKIFNLTGVQLSEKDAWSLDPLPNGTEPFDGYGAYCVKISGEENLIWRTRDSLAAYKMKITKKCIIDEYRRALDAAHLTA
jgi:hypothetical protein